MARLAEGQDWLDGKVSPERDRRGQALGQSFSPECRNLSRAQDLPHGSRPSDARGSDGTESIFRGLGSNPESMHPSNRTASPSGGTPSTIRPNLLHLAPISGCLAEATALIWRTGDRALP